MLHAVPMVKSARDSAKDCIPQKTLHLIMRANMVSYTLTVVTGILDQ